MSNEIKELNEYLAEHLFGMKRDRHREGLWVKPNTTYSCGLPNYCENYQLVLERMKSLYLSHPEEEIRIKGNTANDYLVIIYECASGKKTYGRGDTIGEAICRCAVEYLKRSKKDE